MLRFTASFWRHNLQRVSSSSRAFATTAWWKLRTFKVVAVLRVKTKTQRRWYPQQSGGLHYKVDINYHLFFALDILICNATWSKHCGKVQKSTYKSILSTCRIILSKYKSILAKYKLSISKHKDVQRNNFRNLGNGISGTRHLLNTSGSQNPVPRTGSVQTSGTEPNLSEPIEHRNLRNLGRIPGTGTGSRNPVPGTAPARPEHTEIYIVQKTHSILLLGNKLKRKSALKAQKHEAYWSPSKLDQKSTSEIISKH